MSTPSAVAYLRSTQAIRDRCGQLFDLAQQDQLRHFRLDLDAMDRTARYVIQVMQTAYPDGQIPFHSRWRHFEAGGDAARVGQLSRLDRLQKKLALYQRLAGLGPIETARAKVDLAITSVLLDAGAGAAWRYIEPDTRQVFSRSEGLAVASFHLFQQGVLSSDRAQPLQADSIGLQQLSERRLAELFQVSDQNPLVGVAGRLGLLQQLGQVLPRYPHLFGQKSPRPGHLVDYLLGQAQDGTLAAHTVFEAVLEGLSDIWPGRIVLDGVNLGDVWPHSALPDNGTGSQLVPFHKLSQWLTYSLLEPLQELGLRITDLDTLTGLAEYRNGGLCLDLGLLQPKYREVIETPHLPSSEVVVEWRSLTLILLDRLADTIRQILGMSAAELPLVKVLEGGTWAAGRQIAAERRDGGTPPLQIISDGTVF